MVQWERSAIFTELQEDALWHLENHTRLKSTLVTKWLIMCPCISFLRSENCEGRNQAMGVVQRIGSLCSANMDKVFQGYSRLGYPSILPCLPSVKLSILISKTPILPTSVSNIALPPTLSFLHGMRQIFQFAIASISYRPNKSDFNWYHWQEQLHGGDCNKSGWWSKQVELTKHVSITLHKYSHALHEDLFLIFDFCLLHIEMQALLLRAETVALQSNMINGIGCVLVELRISCPWCARQHDLVTSNANLMS